jgi:hypothetical protein
MFSIAFILLSLMSSPSGALPLPFATVGDLPAGGYKHWVLAVEAGKPMTLLVDGEANGGDLDCYIVENHRFLAKDEGPGNHCEINATPKTNSVIIQISNGRLPERFQLVIHQ